MTSPEDNPYAGKCGCAKGTMAAPGRDVRRGDLSMKEVALTKVEVFGSVMAPTCLRAVTHRQVSENATVDWVKRTALCDIPGNEGVAVKRDGLYRVTDKLLERKEQIEEFLREQ